MSWHATAPIAKFSSSGPTRAVGSMGAFFGQTNVDERAESISLRDNGPTRSPLFSRAGHREDRAGQEASGSVRRKLLGVVVLPIVSWAFCRYLGGRSAG